MYAWPKSGADLAWFVRGGRGFPDGGALLRGLVPYNFFEIWSPDMPFPAFWALHLFLKFASQYLLELEYFRVFGKQSFQYNK